MQKNKNISQASHQQASLIANGTQKKGQSKAQTKLIAAGIEKGIAQYKKQHKAKMREQDKLRKKRSTPELTAASHTSATELDTAKVKHQSAALPWLLLLVSWLGFLGYFVTQ